MTAVILLPFVLLSADLAHGRTGQLAGGFRCLSDGLAVCLVRPRLTIRYPVTRRRSSCCWSRCWYPFGFGWPGVITPATNRPPGGPGGRVDDSDRPGRPVHDAAQGRLTPHSKLAHRAHRFSDRSSQGVARGRRTTHRPTAVISQESNVVLPPWSEFHRFPRIQQVIVN